MTATEALGKAMTKVAREDAPARVMENCDLDEIARFQASAVSVERVLRARAR